MKKAIALLPYIPLRGGATERSEMVSQAIFGEEMEVLEIADSWSRIKLVPDGYEGWCDTKMIRFYDDEKLDPAVPVLTRECRVSAGDEVLVLSAGSMIRGLDAKTGEFTINGKTFHLMDDLNENGILDVPAAVNLMLSLRGIPYLWGGRTVWGLDCSGLSQMFGRLLGRQMPRDASQQVDLGDEVMFIQDIQAGDLAFFGENEKITHVGIVTEKDRILHASGQVRLDKFDQQGIFNSSRKEYSHRLRVIKRLVSNS